jgi:hypothetical protein
VEVHEDWLLHRVEHFDPQPADLSDYEAATVVGFRWWRAEELLQTTESVFPPHLGELLTGLLRDGPDHVPVDITDRSAR